MEPNTRMDLPGQPHFRQAVFQLKAISLGPSEVMASIPAVGDLSVIRVRIQSAVNISKYLNR